MNADILPDLQIGREAHCVGLALPGMLHAEREIYEFSSRMREPGGRG